MTCVLGGVDVGLVVGIVVAVLLVLLVVVVVVVVVLRYRRRSGPSRSRFTLITFSLTFFDLLSSGSM